MDVWAWHYCIAQNFDGRKLQIAKHYGGENIIGLTSCTVNQLGLKLLVDKSLVDLSRNTKSAKLFHHQSFALYGMLLQY